MPSTTFTSGTLITSTWLNEVNGTVHTLFGAATTPAAGRAALNVPTYSELENKNKIVNGAMNIWQRGITFTPSGTVSYTADRFAASSAGGITTATVERTSDAPIGFNYALKVGRPNGSTETGNTLLYHALTTKNSIWAKTQTITISFYAKIGSTRVFGLSPVEFTLYGGTGNDESTSTLGSWAGNTILINKASDLGQLNISTSWARFEYSTTIPSNINQLGFIFNNRADFGTAGSNDYLYITGIQLELGSAASKFEQKTYEADYAACLPYYEKSFYATTTPVQNAGVNSGAWMFPSTKAGASVIASNQIRFETRKRYTPTITTYNPAAANSQPRDISMAADCSGVGTQDVTDSGFVLYCTANAGTSVGNQIKVHWTADSEL